MSDYDIMNLLDLLQGILLIVVAVFFIAFFRCTKRRRK